MFARNEQTDKQVETNEQTDEEIARNSAEIERESIQIQKELEFERKLKMKQTEPKRPKPEMTSTISQKSSSPNVQFRDQTSAMDDDHEHLKTITERQKELESLETKIKSRHSELVKLDTVLRDDQEKAEDARTRLMLTEFKRDNIRKEVEKSTQELYVKKQKVNAIEEEVKSKMADIKEVESLGITKEQLKELQNHPQIIKSNAQKIEVLQLERDELVRQIERVNNDLFSERKAARQQKEELIEEAETFKSKLEDIQHERDQLHQRLVAMETALHKVEEQKSYLLREKSDLAKDFTEKVKREAFDLHRQSEQEHEIHHVRFREMASRILKVEGELQLRDDAIVSLRKQLELAAVKVLEEQKQREAIQMDHRKTFQSLRKDTDVALSQLKESCFLEKQHALETLRDQLYEEQRGVLLKSEDRMTLKLTEIENQAATKDDQIQRLEDEIRSLKDQASRETEKMKMSIYQQLQETIRKERQILENEREWIKKREREAVTSEMKRKVTSLTEELQTQEKQSNDLKDQIEMLKKELEKEKSSSHEAVREKLLAVARVKDQAKADRRADIERIREAVIKENQTELNKLRETVKSQGEELSELNQNKLANEKKDRANSSALDRVERTLINEINEECRRTAAVLGLTPRKINISSNRGDVKGEPMNGQNGQGRKLTTSALANLRACNEELRCHVTEISESLESQRSAVQKAHREKDEAVKQMKRKMEQEKLHELDSLKERLIKDHVEEISKLSASRCHDNRFHMSLWQNDNVVREMKQDVKMWKEEMTNRFSTKLQEELRKRQNKQSEVQVELEQVNSSQQQEISRLEREVTRLAQNQKRLMAASVNAMPQNNSRSLLKPKTTKLQMSPSLDVPLSGNILADAYEQRAKSASREAEFADTRANRNETLLSQKMLEMNKLQSALSNQSKELRQLERAYNQLNDHSRLTRPPSQYSNNSPSHQTQPTYGGRQKYSPLKRPLSLSAL